MRGWLFGVSTVDMEVTHNNTKSGSILIRKSTVLTDVDILVLPLITETYYNINDLDKTTILSEII